MKLYCQHCDELHTLRGSELERAIYTLQQLLTRAEAARPQPPGVPNEVICLEYAVQVSWQQPYVARTDYSVSLRVGKGGGL